MARIDRAMYFINKNSTIESGSNLEFVAYQFFTYWKLSNMFGFTTRAMNAEDIFNGFSQLIDYQERNSAKDLYVNNEVTVESNVEIQFEAYDLDVESSGVAVDNLNEVAFNEEEFEVDEDVFRDDLDEQVRNYEWYVESSTNSINWNDIESDLVEPTEDRTLIYMYDNDLDIHSEDVEAFVSEEMSKIDENNDNMTIDAYISFMIGELRVQMERRNAPEEESKVTGVIND